MRGYSTEPYYGGNVVSVKGVERNVHFTYVENIDYDEFGQRVYMKLGNGIETEYQYDAKRRWLSGIQTMKGTTAIQDITYSLDPVGNVLGYENTAGSYETKQNYTYDELYQLTGVDGETTNYEHGLTEYTSEYQQRFTFDSLGLGNMTKKTSSVHTSNGRVVGDPLNYLQDYEYKEGYGHRAKRIGNVHYQYDLNGNIVAERNGPFPVQEPGEKPVIHDMGDDVYYVEEGWGLREGEEDDEGEYSSEYRWDERNRMVQSGNTRNNVAYEYGEDGERTGKFSSTIGGQQGETLYFNRLWNWRYDGSFTDHNGRESKHIFLGESRIVTKVQGADGVFVEYNERTQQYYYHGDHLGSAQVITNYQGEEYERLEYTPYGELWVDESKEAGDLKIPYRFTGKERDEETGLYYYGARYLDPRTSRWISTDPAMGEYIPQAGKGADGLPELGGIFNTINMHTYHYAGNNPVKLVDPNGQESIMAGDPYLAKMRQERNRNEERYKSLSIENTFANIARSLVKAVANYVETNKAAGLESSVPLIVTTGVIVSPSSVQRDAESKGTLIGAGILGITFTLPVAAKAIAAMVPVVSGNIGNMMTTLGNDALGLSIYVSNWLSTKSSSELMNIAKGGVLGFAKAFFDAPDAFPQSNGLTQQFTEVMTYFYMMQQDVMEKAEGNE